MDAALNVPHVTDEDFIILQDNTAQLLTIANPNLIDLKSCMLYDLTGKLIFSRDIGSEANYSFSTLSLSEAVYIVKLITKNGENTAKKISVFKQN